MIVLYFYDSLEVFIILVLGLLVSIFRVSWAWNFEDLVMGGCVID
jgi:hypothetical protein